VASITERRDHHHPIIAQYLGLGTDKEPVYLQHLAPARTTPSNNRKRARKAREAKSPAGTICSAQPGKSKQRRISDGNVGFRVTKAASSDARSACKDVTASNVSLTVTENRSDPRSENNAGEFLRGANATIKRPTELTGSTSTTTLTQAFAAFTKPSPRSSCTLIASNANRDQPCFEEQSQETISDEFFDDVFDSMDLDSAFDQTLSQKDLPDARNASVSSHPEDSSVTICADEHSSLRDSSTVGPSKKFISPLTRKTEALLWKEAARTSHITDRKPIVRSVFPDAVRDRSPVIGLSSKLLLKTCFRVGEAISQAGKATKHGQDIMFELYARVLSSERNAAKQHFVFSDLFHDRPPYLKGEYEAAIWKNVELFNYDSGRFLSKARMCRCIGKIRRKEKDQTWVMEVLNIWEATWEDIDWVEGIVNS
jgi:hypothetical protein